MPALDNTHRAWLPDDKLLRAASITSACVIAFYVVNPLASLVLLILLAAGTFVLADGRDRLTTATVALPAAFVVWLAVSILWTPEKRPAYGAVALHASVVAATLIALAHMGHLSRAVRRVAAAGMVTAFCIIAWLSLEEALTGHFLRRALNSYVPLTRSRTILLRADSGWIVALQSYATLKNVAALTLMLWPAMLISQRLARAPWQVWLSWGTIAAVVASIVLSAHESSKLALVLGTIVFLVTRMSQKTGMALVCVGWISATMLVIPATLAAYKAGVHKIEQIQYSGRHRLVIWGQTSERILKAPLRGYGLASTRVTDETAAPDVKSVLPGTTIPGGTNVHSHNIFIQAWHEVGGIGALLLMLSGVPVLQWLRTRSATSAPYLFAAFVTGVSMASFSWSLVAVWFIASFGLLAVATKFADLVADDIDTERPSKSHVPVS